MSEETKPEGPSEPSRHSGKGGEERLEAQGEPGSGSKWGFIIVGVLIVALLVVYLNKVVYGDREKLPTQTVPPSGAAPGPGTMPAGAPGASGAAGPLETAPVPPPSDAEMFRQAVMTARIMAAQAIFQIGDKIYMIASIPEVGTQGTGTAVQMVHTFGKFFDVTKLAAGVTRESLYRRVLFADGQAGAMYADALPVLGASDKLMPAIAAASAATHLTDEEPVLGVQIGDATRAYPVRYLNYHEVVNDTLGSTPLVVVWNSLAAAPTAMERRLDGKELLFGTAGLVYQGAIVLYDTESRSLWTPITAKCLAGAYADLTLKPLQVTWTTWKSWLTAHPDTTVLVGPKPEIPQLDYTKNPQVPSPEYRATNQLVYPVEGFNITTTPLPTKEVVFGIQVGDQYRAYPEKTLAEKREVKDTLGGKEITMTYDAAGGFAGAKDAQGNPVLSERMYWIVWKGFHPTSDVYGVIEKPPAAAPVPEAPKY